MSGVLAAIENPTAAAKNLVEEILDHLFGSIRSFLKGQVDLVSSLGSNIRVLERDLPKLKELVWNAEERELDDETRLLLKEIYYDCEDILDEFKREQKKQPPPSSLQVQPHWIWNVIGFHLPFLAWVCRYLPFTCLGTERDELPLLFRARIANQIDMFAAKLREIERMQKPSELLSAMKNLLSRDEAGESSQGPLRRPSTYHLAPSSLKLVGRDQTKRQVEDLLLGRKPELLVVLINGMGGVGKTTLAQIILKESREDFQFTKWVCLGEEKLDMAKVRGQILGRDAATKDEINEELGNKRCLIVMDDVWKESLCESLDELWAPLTGEGSRVIITSRDKDLPKELGQVSIESVRLDTLDDDDCLDILLRAAFSNGNIPSPGDQFHHISKKFVKKLGGLPLAAQVLGSSLRGEPVETWRNEERNIRMSVPKKNEDKIMQIIQWSYRRLPPHLKQCFAYLSLFPKDVDLGKERIALMWIAQNYVVKEKDRTLEEIGKGYFDVLVNASLIQHLDNRYVMHDLIHDFAVCIAGDEYMGAGETRVVTEQRPRVLHHLLYKSPHIPSSAIDEILFRSNIYQAEYFRGKYISYQQSQPDSPPEHSDMKKLRTFISYHPSHANTLCDKLATLRVMVIYSAGHILEGNLIKDKMHLRYLDLGLLDITSLPESFCDLYNLQTFFVPYKLTEFPIDMWKLVNLRHIHGGRDMPAINKVGELKLLQTISCFRLFRGECIRDLRNLSQLRGKLEIPDVGLVENSDDAKYARLVDKNHLSELSLVMQGGDRNGQEIQHLQVLGSLKPNEKLEKLDIKKYCGSTLPTWIGEECYLTELVSLSLSDCNSLKELPPLGHLPNLQYLSLIRVHRLEHIGQEIYGTARNPVQVFPSLKELCLSNMESLVEWEVLKSAVGKGRINYFPCLKSILIDECVMLRYLPQVPPSLTSFYYAKKNVSIQFTLPDIWERCNGENNDDEDRCLKVLDVRECSITHVNNWLHRATSLSRIKLKTCDGLDMFSISSLHLLKEINLENISSLKKLAVRDCRNLNIFRISRLHLLDSLELQNLDSLDELELAWLHSVETIKLLNLKSLSILSIYDLDNLKELVLQNLTSLENVSLSSCPKLEILPNISSQKLRKLKLVGLHSIETIKLLDHNSLSILSIHSLDQPKELVLQNLDLLEELMLLSNGSLSEIHLASIPSLTVMAICNCTALTAITGLQNLTALETIIIVNTWQLQVKEDDKDALKNLSLLITDSWKFLQAVDPRTLCNLLLGMSKHMYDEVPPSEETRLNQWWQKLVSEIIIYISSPRKIPDWMELDNPHLREKIRFDEYSLFVKMVEDT